MGCLRSGLLPSLVGVAHVAIQFPLYEALKSRFGSDQHDLSPIQLVSYVANSVLIHLEPLHQLMSSLSYLWIDWKTHHRGSF